MDNDNTHTHTIHLLTIEIILPLNYLKAQNR